MRIKTEQNLITTDKKQERNNKKIGVNEKTITKNNLDMQNI